MGIVFTNTAASVLTAPMAPTTTALSVTIGTGVLFVVTAPPDTLRVTITDALTGTLHEVVEVTATSGDTFTVTRGMEGTTPLNWNVGDKVAALITAGGLNAKAPKANPVFSGTVTTGFNTLDDGSGNAVIAGTVKGAAGTAPTNLVTLAQAQGLFVPLAYALFGSPISVNTTLTSGQSGNSFIASAGIITLPAPTLGDYFRFIGEGAGTAVLQATAPAVLVMPDNSNISGNSIAIQPGSTWSIIADGTNWIVISLTGVVVGRAATATNEMVTLGQLESGTGITSLKSAHNALDDGLGNASISAGLTVTGASHSGGPLTGPHNTLDDGAGNVTIAGSVHTAHNTLDDGLGNTTISGAFSASNVGAVLTNTRLGGSAQTAVTLGTGNTAVGDLANTAITTGSSNTALGANALQSVISASSNTALGASALSLNTSPNNTAVGANAAPVATTATGLAIIGAGAAVALTTGNNATVLGAGAAVALTTGNNATVLGAGALAANTTGSDNIAIGFDSQLHSTGSSNIAIGSNALGNTSGSNNVAVGLNALNMGLGATTIADTIAIGTDALYTLQSGTANLAIGSNALQASLTGSNNFAMGYDSQKLSTSGYSNLTLGNNSGANLTTGYENICIGLNAGVALTVANDNILIGVNSCNALNTGSNNVFIGNNMMNGSLTNVSDAICIGYGAINASGTVALGYNAVTGVGATVIGYYAGANGGAYQTLLGYQALGSAQPCNCMVAVGYQALQNFRTFEGYNVVAVGYQAGQNSEGGDSIFIGSYAGQNCTSNYNVACGFSALQNASSQYNTAIGHLAMNTTVAATGVGNTAVGAQTLQAITSGAINTSVGMSAGRGITTGSGNVSIGDATAANVVAPAFNITTQNNYISLGSTATTNAYINVAWTVVSDQRDKTNIAPLASGLDLVANLKPISYQRRESRDSDEAVGPVRYGFLAQDVLAAEGENNVLVDAGNPDQLYFHETSLLAVLVKAIQDQQLLIDKLNAKVFK